MFLFKKMRTGHTEYLLLTQEQLRIWLFRIYSEDSGLMLSFWLLFFFFCLFSWFNGKIINSGHSEQGLDFIPSFL